MFWKSDLTFNIKKLQTEYKIAVDKFEPIVQHGISNKTFKCWKTLSIISSNGSIYNDSPGKNYKRTKVIKYLPYTNSILKKIEKMGYKLKRVRYSILPSDCFIQWHYDEEFSSIINTRICI